MKNDIRCNTTTNAPLLKKSSLSALLWLIPLLAHSVTQDRTGRFKRKWRRRDASSPTIAQVAVRLAAAAVAADRDRRFKPPHEKFPSPLDRPSRDLDLYAFTGCRCRSLASGFDRVVVKRLVIGLA